MKSDQLIDFTKSDDFFHASMVDGCLQTVAGGFFKNRCNLPSMIPRKPSLSSLEQSNASVMERLQVRREGGNLDEAD